MKGEGKDCKIIAKGTWYKGGSDSGDFVDIIYEIPNATIANNPHFINNDFSVSTFDLAIKILSFNEDGDLFNLHI